MIFFAEVLQPKTIEEATEMMETNKQAPLFAGGCWLRLGKRRMPAVIDLAGLGLRYIKEEDEEFVIGAMATQRDVELYEPFQTFCGGVLPKAVIPILGVQFRNMATMGGSVASKFGFSDIIPALLALNADVVFAKSGRMSLADFMKKSVRELLVEIRIPKKEAAISIDALRKSASDFPFLTGAARKDENGYSVYIGNRPATPALAEKTCAILNEKGIEALEEAVQMVGEEFKYMTSTAASDEYRKAMAMNMTRRLILEVEAWK